MRRRVKLKLTEQEAFALEAFARVTPGPLSVEGARALRKLRDARAKAARV